MILQSIFTITQLIFELKVSSSYLPIICLLSKLVDNY